MREGIVEEHQKELKRETEAVRGLLPTEMDGIRRGMETNFNDLIRVLTRQLQDERDRQRGRAKESLTNKKKIAAIPNYSGKHSEYPDWQFKMMRFMNEDVQFKETIFLLNQFKSQPTPEDLSDMFDKVESKRGEEKLTGNMSITRTFSTGP